MKKWLILVLISVACKQTNPEAMIPYLQGYWEIEKVVLADGTERNYSINTIIDHLQWEDTIGYRTKLQPQLDGSYLTNEQTEVFRLLERNDSLIALYQTPFDTWEEYILNANDQELVIKNKDGYIYYYHPFKSFDLKP